MVGTLPPVIMIEKLALAVAPHASATVSVKLKVPAVVGVPVIAYPPPTSCTVRPGGSVPLPSWNFGKGVNGVTHPPDVFRLC